MLDVSFHPVCDEFDRLSAEEYERLESSIIKNGCQVSVVIWVNVNCKKWVIDGRHRVEICNKHSKPYPTKIIGGTEADAIELARSLNKDRRHRPYGQRALDAAREATAADGNPKNKPQGEDTSSIEEVTRHEAAERHGVTVAAIDRAKFVLESGTPALQLAVAQGAVAVSDAAAVAGEPAKIQNAAVKKVIEGKAKTARAAVKPGKPLFDNKTITQLIGKIVRAVDQKREAHGDTPGYRDMWSKVQAVDDSWRRWMGE